MASFESRYEKSVDSAVSFARTILSNDELGRLYWLSGSTCAGKTTTSSVVADRLQWAVYHCDDWEAKHRERADSRRHPSWTKYSQLTGDPLWLQPIEQHLALDALATREQFELIVEDLSALLKQDSRPLLYDGFVAPEILTALIPSKSHAVYLVSTETFQRRNYEQRPWIKDVLSRTSDPIQAWNNWMARDAAGARTLETAIRQTELPWISVDGTDSIEKTIERICGHFLGRSAV